jgi:prepilin-type N-terminal cleavage/methylation domain-containing protein
MQMVFPISTQSQRRRRGMTLFEVLIALGVFGIAALALVKTLHLMGEMTLESRTLRQVEQSLESLIDEYSKLPGIDERDEEIKADAKGVSYRVVIRPVEGLRNREGRDLQGFFSIRVIATWKEGRATNVREAEVLRFVNAFIPTGA